MLTDVPFAHRGLHDVANGRVENALSSFEAAVQFGVGIELDVQLTADSEAVVFHDYELDRLTERTGLVRHQTRDDLSKITLSGSNDCIPGLDTILRHVNGRVPILVELKDQDGQMGPNIGLLESAVLDVIKAYRGECAVMSFNPHSVRFLGQQRPDLCRGLVTSDFRYKDWSLPKAVCDRLCNVPDYTAIGASFISHEARDLDSPRVAHLKAEGATILCWTIRSQEEANEALKVADNITFEGFLPA